MLVRDIMRSPVVGVSPGTTLADAYRTMREKGFRHLVVLDGDWCVRQTLIGGAVVYANDASNEPAIR